MKRYPAAALLAGSVVVIAGCGSAGSGQSASAHSASLHVLQAAAASTTAAKSARLSLSEQVTVAGRQGTATGTGEEDFASRAFSLAMSVVGQTIVMKKVGNTMYVKMPAALRRHIPGGKPWLAVNLNTITRQATGSSFSQLTQGSQSDPATLLSYLQSVSANGLHRGGTTSIRGVPATEYDATVDLSAVADRQGPAGRRAIQLLVKQLRSSSYPMKVWVDRRGLVRQVQFVLSFQPVGATPVKVAATEQLYDFGAPVNLAAPPAARTADVTGRVASQLSASSGA